ncbi:MAG TPA: ABC transporter permease subunit [Gemmataceae bacterium]|nr:ABC transporter permease subunit [Gemmataceae bacterium]
MSVGLPPPLLPVARAWLELVWLSIRRQARMRQMLVVAVALMILAVVLVSVITFFGRWTLHNNRPRPRSPTYQQSVYHIKAARMMAAPNDSFGALLDGIGASVQTALDHGAFVVFSRWIVFAIFQSFLLPLWTLSFATDALGNERESRTLIWLTTRPLPRSAVYLAKYVAMLPWCLGLNLLGFGAICLAGGEPGRLAWDLFWPAVCWGTIAFAALFHLLAALFRRPAVVALIYSFFFETVVSDLPGDLKRLSISYYIRSLMFDSLSGLDMSPDQVTVYAPVSGWTAWGVLVGVTVVLIIIGMVVFSRMQYQEDV